MSDSLLTPALQKEALSRVYAQTIAARAGYTISITDFDVDGIDITINAGGQSKPTIGIQLKATENLTKVQNGTFRFVLKRRNYDLLKEYTRSPRILVVLDLPKDASRWINVTEEELILRRAAYWLNLKGYADTKNTTSVTVYIPIKNLFNVENLQNMMEQARKGATNEG